MIRQIAIAKLRAALARYATDPAGLRYSREGLDVWTREAEARAALDILLNPEATDAQFESAVTYVQYVIQPEEAEL